jgi:hypothetical protein
MIVSSPAALRLGSRGAGIFAAAVVCFAGAALAQTPAAEPVAPAATATPAAEPISIELNKLEPQDKACRAYLVLSNPGGPDITDLKLDLILFSPEQIIERRIAVGLAPLPMGKTTVKLFDIDGQDCTKIGSVLINEVMACTGADGAVADCAKRITPTSRVNAKLFK